MKRRTERDYDAIKEIVRRDMQAAAEIALAASAFVIVLWRLLVALAG